MNTKNPGTKREIFGWAMYDVANQAYTTVVISFVYGAFFIGYIVPEDSAWRDSYWSIALVVSMLFAMVLSPMAGHLIDQGRSKKWLLATSTVFCVVFTSLLWFVQPGYIWWAIAFLVISNTAWMLGEAIVSSFLPDIASRKNMGVVSGFGWGLGYIGGLISMVLVTLLIVTADPTDQVTTYIRQNQWSMVAISIYFLLFAIPTFVLLRDHRHTPDPAVVRKPLRESLNLVQTYREQPVLMQFFFAFLFYTAGVQTVIKFIGIYTSSELGMTPAELIPIFLATQISAMIGAISFGFVERRIGARATLYITIAIWLVAITAMHQLQTIASLLNTEAKQLFVYIALLAGTGIGSIQSSSRSLVGQLTQTSHAGSAFGLWGFFLRSAAILAAMFGVVADIFSRQNALLMVIGFFIVGAVLLARVPLGRTIKQRLAEDDARADA